MGPVCSSFQDERFHMKIVPSFLRPSFSCETWKSLNPNFNDSECGSFYRDEYSADIPIPSGTQPQDHFNKYKEKLFDYRIFPEKLMKFHICSASNQPPK